MIPRNWNLKRKNKSNNNSIEFSVTFIDGEENLLRFTGSIKEIFDLVVADKIDVKVCAALNTLYDYTLKVQAENNPPEKYLNVVPKFEGLMINNETA